MEREESDKAAMDERRSVVVVYFQGYICLLEYVQFSRMLRTATALLYHLVCQAFLRFCKVFTPPRPQVTLQDTQS